MMKTSPSSQYPVLDSKPIDQWKVTELKEELKRRMLKTGGLKDELIRRLDEALRTETGETNVEGDNDYCVEEPECENVVTGTPAGVTEQLVVEAGGCEIVASGNAEETVGNADEIEGEPKADANGVSIEVDCKESGELLVNDGSVEEQHSGFGANPVSGEGMMTTTDTASVTTGNEVSKEQQPGLVDNPVYKDGSVTVTDVASAITGDEVREGCFSETAVVEDGLVDGKTERDNGDSGEQEHSEGVTQAHEDVKLDSSVLNNQVSEVSTSVGFPVKSNISVSTNSLSVIEKNDLKDNFIADNVKLESDVKPEMVQPSSSDFIPDGGEAHPNDIGKPHENENSVEETDDSVANADMSQKIYSTDLGSEKLNVDQSSGNDSMEEDALESKQINSNYNSEDVGEKTEKFKVTTFKAESPVASTMDTDLPAEKKVIHDLNNELATLSDKRKLSEEESVLNKPAKRQHRWKTENNTVTEPQVSHIPPASILDAPQSIALRRNLSRSNSNRANDPPKDREVPPPTKPATKSLRIDRFLRPFTMKAVQDLLGKTGVVTSFWMDHIKTHCYVTYSSVEEAVETRNAVYNLQWPPNGGHQLVAEFVDPGEVKSRLEPAPAPHMNSAPTKAPEPPTIPHLSPSQQSLRQQKARQPDTTLPPPPPPPHISIQPAARERVPPPPPLIEKVDAPILTLDDLFRKTKATPRIYYMPLSDELVAAKRKNLKQ
ncbi:hypothetical protein RND81_06G026400 [Saponaria officinalis]|uniref:SAP domain-containing protein n=1 Tax=Saponaria officinalis TaxID=3572 RepID=A0AAW1K744_SAPOF